MKKYFITYGDDAFYLSRNQLAKLAHESGLFDEVIVYTPKDLPDSIKASPLMAYRRGRFLGMETLCYIPNIEFMPRMRYRSIC